MVNFRYFKSSLKCLGQLFLFLPFLSYSVFKPLGRTEQVSLVKERTGGLERNVSFIVCCVLRVWNTFTKNVC